eukprot:Blabericola_migrator_1__8886@NODE_46_length_16830_cov_132_783392_g42_i0_p10_GENE_NODE_46_length_16830_cov_132_783392_g42_i0NODE_46_length_16830_cov_132_783392_g42_i0_p10_ORF_typecomplete_len209_score26_59_NODE_46_length_16830_cov_132_783392_g42_i045555181
MTAKLREFEKVLLQERLKQRAHVKVCFDLACFGDNDFEAAAFKEVATQFPGVRSARMIKCTQGLPPQLFLVQVRAMEALVQSWITMLTQQEDHSLIRASSGQRLIRRLHESKYTLIGIPAPPPANGNNCMRVGRYVTLQTWEPTGFRSWLKAQLLSERTSTKFLSEGGMTARELATDRKRRWLGFFARHKQSDPGKDALEKRACELEV